MCKISVIIPVYNVEKYLKKCLNSIIHQTCKDIEIICVDDGSTDNSLDILKQYSKEYNNLKFVKQKNAGPGYARNNGMQYAKGEYIHFMDSDDFLPLNFYEIMYNFAAENNADICICDIDVLSSKPEYAQNGYFDLSNYSQGPSFRKSTFRDYSQFLFYKSWNVWNKLYKKDFIEKNKLRFNNKKIFEDGVFHFNAMFKAINIAFVDKKLYKYNIHSEKSLTNTASKSGIIMDFVSSIADLEKVLYENNVYSEYKKDFINLVLNQSDYNLSKIEKREIMLPVIEQLHNYVKYLISEEDINTLEPYCKNIYYKLLNKSYLNNNNEYKYLKNANKYINIILASNDFYSQHLCVTIASIIKNSNKNDCLAFYILDSNISEEHKFFISKLKEIKDFKLFFIKISEETFLKLSTVATSHVTKEAYYRYIIPDLFNHLEKAIYLDVDIIVKKSLREFYNIPFDENYVIAIEDCALPYLNSSKRYTDTERYFNSGVMVINIKKWLIDDIRNKLFNTTIKMFNSGKLIYPDQDVLNNVLKDNIKFVSPEYNLQTACYIMPEYLKVVYSEFDMNKALKSPTIIHYTTDKKPWNYDSPHGYKNEYFDYLKLTKFYIPSKKNISNLQKIFSIKNVGTRKLLTIFGLKFKFKVKTLMIKQQLEESNGYFHWQIDLCNKQIQVNNQSLQSQIEEINKENQELQSQIEEINKENQELQSQIKQIQADNQNILKKELYEIYFALLINNCKHINNTILQEGSAICSVNKWDTINYLFPEIKIEKTCVNFANATYLFAWGTRFFEENFQICKNAVCLNKPFFVLEDGFIRSIDTWVNEHCSLKYQEPISFTINSAVPYFDARFASELELMLNDKSLIINDEQKQRARKCIDTIVNTHLTKYNHQPIYEPKIGRDNARKILVVDQSYGDMSIAKGLASDNTFRNMLYDAIAENPDADIIVKTHPDTIAGAGGYYKGLESHDNVYAMKEAINPISLIKYCDEVYVCTTQLGFEALMCNKKVHVYGMPFYAGWGLTIDKQKCDRRSNIRTLEEVFYIAYIMYSRYVNPDRKSCCEIEEAMDYLLKLRDEYFEEKNKSTLKKEEILNV